MDLQTHILACLCDEEEQDFAFINDVDLAGNIF
jgi:hypothetical protein